MKVVQDEQCVADRNASIDWAACPLAIGWFPERSGSVLRAQLPNGEEMELAQVPPERAYREPFRWFGLVLGPVIDVLGIPYWIVMATCSSMGLCSGH